MLLVLFAGGVAAQVYRYVRFSGRLERQQTRWLLTALALWLALAVLLVLTPLRGLYDDATSAGLVTYAVTVPLSVAVVTLIPASIALAILRYRLYDIDVWISRAVLYFILTIFVIGTYSALVTAVGQTLGRRRRAGARDRCRSHRAGLQPGACLGPAARQPPDVRRPGRPLRGAFAAQ